MNKKPAIFSKLKQLNKKRAVKIRSKKLKNGYTLYLEIYYGNGKRNFEFPNPPLRISGKRNDHFEDNIILEEAIKLQEQKSFEFKNDIKGYKRQLRARKMDFIEFAQDIINNEKPQDQRYWKATLKYLKKFRDEYKINLNFKYANTEDFGEKFKKYLSNQVSEYSAYIYFIAFKAIVNKAVKRRFISSSEIKYVNLRRPKNHPRFLTMEELKKLSITPCPNSESRNAYLFAVFTGLRFSDIIHLEYDKNIYKQNSDIFLKVKQKKTEDPLTIKIHPSAQKILEEQQRKNGNSGDVFKLNTIAMVGRHLKTWANNANIKPFTFHSSRHTFAVLLLSNGQGIFTVSKLLGHKNIQTTQIYADIVDSTKDLAIDSLPSII